MGTALLVLAAGAGLACPLHMWWRMRRGQSACCAPSSAREDDVARLVERRRALAEQLAVIDRAARSDSRSRAGYAVRQ